MGLHIRRAPSRKFQLIATLFAAFALGAQPLYGALVSQIAHAARPVDVVDSADYKVDSEGQSDGRAADDASVSQTPTSPMKNVTNNTIKSTIPAPSVPTITSPEKDAYLNDHFIYYWTKSDGADHYEITRTYMRDGAPVSSVKTANATTHSQALDGLSARDDGPITIQVCAVNIVGDQTCDTVDYVFDATAPVIVTPVVFTDGTNAEGATIKGEKTFHITQAENNPGKMYVEYDQMGTDQKWHKQIGVEYGGTNVADFTVDSSKYADGEYQVKVSSDDAAGNHSGYAFGVRSDNTAPNSTIVLTSPANPMASTSPISFGGVVSGDFGSLKLFRDGNSEVADLTAEAKSSNGSWTYTIPKEQVVKGTYNFSIVAADIYGNETTRSLAPIVVSGYVSTSRVAPPANFIVPLASVNLVPRSFTGGTTQPFTAVKPSADKDSAVLGAQDANGAKAQSSDMPVVAATADGWKFFGITWYWWTLLALIIAGGVWWTAASVRRRAEQLA